MRFISIYNNAFTDEFCDRVIKSYEWMLEEGCLKGDHDVSNNNYRKDKCIFMDMKYDEDLKSVVKEKTQITDLFIPTVLECVDQYLKDLGLYDKTFLVPEGVKVHKYDHKKSGGYYVFHCERENPDAHYALREIVYTLYLNDIPEGEGETEFLYQGFRYQPKKGDLVMFPAGFTHTHRGNPVYTTDKYIVTGWMLRADPSTQETKTKDA